MKLETKCGDHSFFSLLQPFSKKKGEKNMPNNSIFGADMYAVLHRRNIDINWWEKNKENIFLKLILMHGASGIKT